MKKIMILLICAAFCLSGCGSRDAVEFVTSSESVPDAAPAETAGPESIFVYICGAVNEPGVYELAEGSRIFQAVEAAGGFSTEADPRLINQAQVISDGEQITVYTREETEARAAAEEAADSGLVNINTADESQLKTLPGIGDAKAAAIISYREEHGAFADIADICNVTGIKERLYAQISGLITV